MANYGDEYIEIINIGVNPANLKGWKLQDSTGENPYTLPEIILQPRQITRLYASETGISLSDGGDGVRLINPKGQIVDAFDYPLVEAADRTWCRLPDGNGAWVFGCWPTPGRPNTRSRGGEPVPVVVSPICPLADTVPMSIQLAECGSAGDAIWDSGLWKIGEFWMKSRGKWGLFIE